MRKKYRFLLAFLVYALLLLIGNWVGGTGIKDEWDNLMDWVKK